MKPIEIIPPLPEFQRKTLDDLLQMNLVKDGHATEAAKKAVEQWERITEKVDHAKRLGFVWKRLKPL